MALLAVSEIALVAEMAVVEVVAISADGAVEERLVSLVMGNWA
jgi:hypothetical protein